jgi:hypothetical protein
MKTSRRTFISAAGAALAFTLDSFRPRRALANVPLVAKAPRDAGGRLQGENNPPPIWDKRLLYWGWDRPTPVYVRDHRQLLEGLPFDGYVIDALSTNQRIFTRQPWPEAEFTQETNALVGIPWTRRMDNFLIMYSATDSGWDWFNDEHWAIFEGNLRLLARASARASLKGLCFDAEPYGISPWRYASQPSTGQFTYAEFCLKVRERGARFGAILAQEDPNAILFAFWAFGVFQDIVKLSLSLRQAALEGDDFGLLLPFVEGILQGSNVHIVDGNELGWYNKNPEEFYRDAHAIRVRASDLVHPDLQATYRARVDVGAAIYVDWAFALGMFANRGFTRFLTYEEQLLLIEYSTFWSLYTADRYGWIFSEDTSLLTENPRGSDVIGAVTRSKLYISQGFDLDFDMREIIERAEEMKG